LSLVLTSWDEILRNYWSIDALTVSFGLRISAFFCGISYDVYDNSLFEEIVLFFSLKMENSLSKIVVTTRFFYRVIPSLSSDPYLKPNLFSLPSFLFVYLIKVKH
jgi:hypothetical protein